MIKSGTFFEDYSSYLFFEYIRHLHSTSSRQGLPGSRSHGWHKADHKFCYGELHNSQPFTSLCSGFRQSLPEWRCTICAKSMS